MNAGDAYKAVAKSAVGRGIRHSFLNRRLPPQPNNASAAPVPEAAHSTSEPQRDSSQESLTQLAANYRNSLIDYHGEGNVEEQFNFDTDPTPLSQMCEDGTGSNSGLFSRDPSLLELAMIPELDEGGADDGNINGFSFVDFPNPEVRPKSSNWDDNV